MTSDWSRATWAQYGGAIQALENSIRACPDDLWGDVPTWQGFSYIAFHTLFWLDYYLSESPESYVPPAPFGREEMDPEGVLPPRTYTRDELLAFLEHGRRRCRALIASLTDEAAAQPSCFPRQVATRGEALFYNMRHVQHHTGQLQLLLRQHGVEPPRWARSDATPLYG